MTIVSFVITNSMVCFVFFEKRLFNIVTGMHKILQQLCSLLANGSVWQNKTLHLRNRSGGRVTGGSREAVWADTKHGDALPA